MFYETSVEFQGTTRRYIVLYQKTDLTWGPQMQQQYRYQFEIDLMLVMAADERKWAASGPGHQRKGKAVLVPEPVEQWSLTWGIRTPEGGSLMVLYCILL
jgi:hypothetical protein